MHLEGVITVLSGMSDMEQVEDNIKIADEMGPLTSDENKVINQAMDEIKKVPQIQCTSCKYCREPCPKDINIPVIINSLNDYAKYQNLRAIKRMYTMITGGAWGGKPAKASDCISCGVCQTHCPQNIEIIEAMKEAVNLFE
jgi:predicted aldo/keto reductase-like oxidoreductase